MTEFNPAALSSIGPKEFAQLVKSTPDSKIAEVMASDARTKILDEVFNRMPTLFRADKAGNTSAVIHWIITGGAGGTSDTYETVIENGGAQIRRLDLVEGIAQRSRLGHRRARILQTSHNVHGYDGVVLNHEDRAPGKGKVHWSSLSWG